MQALAPTVIALFSLGLFALMFRWLRWKQQGRGPGDAMFLFVVALVVRIVAAVAVFTWLSATTDSPFLFGLLGDDSRYHLLAEGLARRWSTEGFQLPGVLYTRGFEVGLATLYWLMTPSVLVGIGANVVAGALIPVATYRLVRELDEPETAWVAGVLAAIFPPLVFWSTVLYKDTLLTLALLVVLVAGAEVLRVGRLWTASLAVGGLALVAVAVLRLQSVLLVAIAIASSAMVRRGRTSTIARVARVVIAGAIVWFALAIFSTTMLSGGGRGLTWYLGLDRIDLFYEARSLAFQTRSNAIENTFLSGPIQFLATFFLPLPLLVDVGSQWQATEHALLAGNVVWLWLLFYVGMAGLRATPAERWKWLPIIAMMLGTAVAISVRGYAMIYRHKVQMYPFAIMLASLSFVRISEGAWPRSRWVGVAYAAAVGLVIVLYNYLRVGLVAR